MVKNRPKVPKTEQQPAETLGFDVPSQVAILSKGTASFCHV
jgi:hypothetical protein